MLTQNDLQAIGKIIDNKFDSRLSGIEKRLGSMEIKFVTLEKKFDLVETKLIKKIDRLDRSMNKKLDVVISYFEYRDVDLEKRVNRIETHLSLAPLNS